LKVKIGMVSFAHMHAYSYARAIGKISEVDLAGIYDDNPYRGTQAARMFGTTYFEDYEDLLDQRLDGVIICSENALHREHVRIASEHKVHILCEKPIATSLEDAQFMIEVCQKNKVKLQTAFPMRYSPPVRFLKEYLDRGSLGKVVAASCTNHGTVPPGWFQKKELSGGGAIMDHTVHVVDLLRWMLKTEVKKVYAHASTLIQPLEVEDCALLSLTLGNGVIASLDCSWSRPKNFPFWGDVTMRIYGTEGVIDMDAFKQGIASYNDERIKSIWHYWGQDPDLEMIRDFISCIKENRPVSIIGEDGRKALAVALSAYRSLEKGDTVYVDYG